jgi:hypothetical protein
VPEKNPDIETLDTGLDFWDKVFNADVVRIRFRKKNNEMRDMLATLNFTRIPKEDHPKSVNLKKIVNNIRKNKILHVYDLQKNAWRSVPFDRLTWLRIGNKIYYRRELERE